LTPLKYQIYQVSVITLIIVVFGIIGRVVTKNKSFTELGVLALVLNLVWVFGYFAMTKVEKNLSVASYRNLKGHNGFEMLMIFTQMQNVLLTVIVIVICHRLPLLIEGYN